MSRLKAALKAGVCLLVLAVPSAAFAQSAGGSAAGTSPDATATPPSQEAEARPQDQQDSGGLAEIVVTANRRNENIQRVPIAINAIGSDTLESSGVGQTESLQAVVPGMDFSRQSGNGAAPFIRGVGSVQTNAGSEAPVAIYVDDVYLSGGQSNLFSFNNIEQVSVLKGPQGTLFGRNATAGVIQVRTKLPSHDSRLDATVGYGNYNTFSGSLYATTGLSDTVAIDIAATGEKQQDGFGRNVTTGDDIYKQWNWGIRSSLLWEPSSSTTIRLSGDFSKSMNQLGLNPSVNPGTVSSGNGVYVGRYRSSSNTIDQTVSRAGGVSLKIEQDLGFAKLVSISAYRHLNYAFLFDQDAGPLPATLSDTRPIINTLSQELQLQSRGSGPFTWILGAFYYRAKAGEHPIRNFNQTSSGANAYTDLIDDQTLNSIAGFGEINYEFLPGTRATVGLRYTSDDYHLDVLKTNALGATLAGGQFSQDATFSKFTYRGILSHDFAKDIMAYASISRGFKSGGFNVAAPGNAPGAAPVAPEVLDAYEVGLKTELFDRHLRFNAAAFHYKYANLQVTIIGPGSSSVINAAAAEINGLDFDATIAATSNLQINFGASFLDGEYLDFRNGPLYVPKPGSCTPTPVHTGAPTGGNLQCSADLSGNTTIRTPKFTGNINIVYTVPTSFGDIGLSGNIYHNSGYFWEPDNRTQQNAYELVNATISWKSPDGKLEASLWGKNLLNTYYIAFGSESSLRDSQSPAPPRTYGVSFGVHF